MVHDGKSERGLFAVAGASSEPPSRVAAGPFDLAGEHIDGSQSLSDALTTGLLIIYPVLATVVALLVGLSLSGPVV